jgi:hypothetical protein
VAAVYISAYGEAAVFASAPLAGGHDVARVAVAESLAYFGDVF